MIRDLVLYFLRQGVYNNAGDIAVLCAYLGQLQKVRAALRDLKIAVSIDERDQDQLVRQGIEEEAGYEEVLVTKHVCQHYYIRRILYLIKMQVKLGTVDIFQGQEAKIVIVSLVRNSGTFDTGSASIGFLKVPIALEHRNGSLTDPACRAVTASTLRFLGPSMVSMSWGMPPTFVGTKRGQRFLTRWRRATRSFTVYPSSVLVIQIRCRPSRRPASSVDFPPAADVYYLAPTALHVVTYVRLQ